MKIVIDCRPLLKNNFTVEYSRYLTGAISYLQKEKPQVEFFFLLDKNAVKKTSSAFSFQHTILNKSLPGLAGWKIWYRWQIPSILQKNRADLFLTTGGIASGFIDIPQCICIPGIQKDNYLKKKYFEWIKKKLPATLVNAKIIFTNSEKNKKDLTETDPSIHSKIIVIPPVADQNTNPLSWEERENIKMKYAGGKDFFLINQPDFAVPDFILLLKAFSQFKKRQHSNMQLVIAGANKRKKISEKLEGFRYRGDVHLYDDLEQTIPAKIWAAAYGLLQPDVNINTLLNSFKMHVPVITNKKEYPPELDRDAVLYADFTDMEELAGRLMLLYKNETLRDELIEKGNTVTKQFNPQSQLMQLWDGLISAMKN